MSVEIGWYGQWIDGTTHGEDEEACEWHLSVLIRVKQSRKSSQTFSFSDCTLLIIIYTHRTHMPEPPSKLVGCRLRLRITGAALRLRQRPCLTLHQQYQQPCTNMRQQCEFLTRLLMHPLHKTY